MALAMWHEGCETGNVEVRSDTTTLWDTIVKHVPTKPKPYAVIQVDTIPANVDTAAILASYYTATEWRDSIDNDTLSIAIIDTLIRNAIQGRSVAYTLRLPIKTITNTITTTKHVSGLYITPYASQDRTIGIGATYVAPRWLGSVGYGTNGVQVGVGVKIGK